MGRRLPKIFLQIAAVVLIALLLGIFAWQLVNRDSATSLGDRVNAGATPPAPTFELERLVGDGTLSLASLRGKAVVLNFWASWCEPCKEESPRLEQAWQQWRHRDVVFVGIDSQDLEGDAMNFARRYGLTYPLLHDGPGAVIGHYGVTGFPETWFVDRHGRLVGPRIQGPISNRTLRRNIQRALESS